MKQLATIDKPDTKPRRLTRWQVRFLEALRRSPHVGLAAKAAGVSRETCYVHRRENPLFAEQWQSVLDEAVDNLETRAFELALQDNVPLLMFLLRCHRPSVYRETNRVEHALLGKVVFVLPEKEEREP